MGLRGCSGALVCVGLILTLKTPGLAQSAAPSPTFSRDVAPILYEHCASCHRAGEIAPMPLLSYEQVRPWAAAIREQVLAGTMPPWHADAPRGTFANDRRLSDTEKDVIWRWVALGAPKGDARDLPPSPKFADTWQIGTPGAVITMPTPYTVPATGEVEYQNFTAPTNFTEDKWVQAIEVRPGARSVVHHILVFISGERPEDAYTRVVPPQGPRRHSKMSGTLLATTAPGTNALTFEPGTAMLVPAGSSLRFQIHYTTNGKPTTDQSSVGIIFAKQRPLKVMHTSAFYNPTFVLPAEAPDTEVPSAIEFHENVHLTALFPHTHLRGKSWEYKLVYPDGRTEKVLSVPHYDFNWQTYYVFATPLGVPKGTKLEAVAHYDNSVNNKSNPDPTKNVRWGEQTWDEMQYTGINYTVDDPLVYSAGDQK